MKKFLKGIWNMIVILTVLAIFPVVLMIDVIKVHFAYFF
ncbi:putative inner membrane protein [Pectobacterium bacteriophage PM2]|uniref:Putative inner membrane protein n=1 Tax=Pectobacterium bacteriophage PM2 TaxID=1429794 RepID=A0A0A0Q2I4_9CAUD|nr:putative inner membrane protein [Pectobacterium bacteriophage PM2]AHY25250.1 putative inner membrane protein [Pectobacterium bacteriophage PM2]